MGKRSKRSRLRGKRTCGYGHKSKHRGKGSKGGKGMAGTGKRAGQLRTWVIQNRPGYFGKHGFKSLKATRIKTINLDEIQERIHDLIKSGMAKKTELGTEINLQDYKVLSRGEVNQKLIIKANSFSKKAEEKIVKAGGKIE